MNAIVLMLEASRRSQRTSDDYVVLIILLLVKLINISTLNHKNSQNIEHKVVSLTPSMSLSSNIS